MRLYFLILRLLKCYPVDLIKLISAHLHAITLTIFFIALDLKQHDNRKNKHCES